MDDLSPLVADWPVREVAVAVLSPDGMVAGAGDRGRVVRTASISKVLTAYAGLRAVDAGIIHLDDPAGRPGATIRHLLSHAAGYAFNGARAVAPVGARRAYSNVGIEVFAAHLEQTVGRPFDEILADTVFEPLEMSNSRLVGSPAHGVHSDLEDLVRFAWELLRPEVVDPGTLNEATSIQFPDLGGVVPGVGRFDPNPWGLGVEIKADKSPHWTGTRTSRRTFGHFGGSGTFLWVDPEVSLACVMLGDRPFGPWALQSWPPFGDSVLERYGS